MNRIKFECRLLTDIVISQKAATEGTQETLDFIPGSNFLGIVASQLYDKLSPEEQILVFHSGKVRFGDAHPMINNIRGVRIPFAMFQPKLKDLNNNEYYIHHHIDSFDNLFEKQLKQCRSGFYCFTSENTFYEIKLDKNFAIKSAHDQEKRRSKDEQMYGYQSLNEGMTMAFEVQFDDEVSNDIQDKIIKSLANSKKRVGRSRTAQYGLVDISEKSYEDAVTAPLKGNKVVIYADSRLVFFDEYNQPTFQPSVKQLLGEDVQGEIIWKESQIRTFQYAPWNFKRQARDIDRSGIEKGSVIVVELESDTDKLTTLQTVGKYKNEGFGRIIINPVFLTAKEGSNGLSVYKTVEAPKDKIEESISKGKLSPSDNLLLAYLKREKKNEEDQFSIFQKVNKFRKDNEIIFRKAKFASQWGSIRSIALRENDSAKIYQDIIDYISHGVKTPDWEGRRRCVLEKFLEECKTNDLRESVINLASEMGKASNRKEK